jgi:hypothetical protein
MQVRRNSKGPEAAHPERHPERADEVRGRGLGLWAFGTSVRVRQRQPGPVEGARVATTIEPPGAWRAGLLPVRLPASAMLHACRRSLRNGMGQDGTTRDAAG